MEFNLKDVVYFVTVVGGWLVAYTRLTSKVEEQTRRIEKVEKYSGELFGRISTLENAKAAQEQINKNIMDNLSIIRTKVESIDDFVRNK